MKSLNFKATLTLLFCMLFLAGCVTVPRQPVMAPAQEGIYHIVGSGQTLYRIAKTYNVDINEIMRVNKITDPTQIGVGQQLFVPGVKAKEIVERGESEAVVVSLAAAGAILVSKEITEHIMPPTVPIISKVGAGDSMVAGIVLGLAKEMPLREAVGFGVAAGPRLL